MDVWLSALLAVFLVTQGVYGLKNLFDNLLLYPRGVNEAAADEPSEIRPLHVLVPVYEERRELLEETLEGIYGTDYPSDAIYTYVIYEPDDDHTAAFIDDLVHDATFRGWSVRGVEVNRETLATHTSTGGGSWAVGASEVPRTKAAALTYTFISQSFRADDVVTVLDADTRIPRDLFRRGVASLETYDLVQAKQTVRNVEDGWLPLLESMGITAWANIVYPKTSRGPYQLLGKGYFIEAGTLYDVGSWQIDEVTEDMALGISAYAQGYSLGVLDCYVRDLCPFDFDDWVRQKRRWVSGPYRFAVHREFTPADYARFWTFTFWNQLSAITHLFGVPAGLAVLALVLGGFPVPLSWPVRVLLVYNLLNWVYYTLQTYRTTRSVLSFRTRWRELWYYVRSNPLTQLAYNALWAVPIAIAVGTLLRGEVTTFEVTPKPVSNRSSTEPAD